MSYENIHIEDPRSYLSGPTFYHETLQTEEGSKPLNGPSPKLRRQSIFVVLGLTITTTFSFLLLSSSVQRWTFPIESYRFIIRNRASVQLVVQLLSNSLALINVTILCIIINRGTRIHWKSHSESLDMIRFWNGLSVRATDWTLPLHLLLPLLLFILVTATPSAIWAGAMTPVSINVTNTAHLAIPAYKNTTYIREWQSEIGYQGPILSTALGLFSYSVTMALQAALLSSASSASPVDDSIWQHRKLDYSRFAYTGRSFGVAAAVGLEEIDRSDGLLQVYGYQEPGFRTNVTCEYNSTAEFLLLETEDTFLYKAVGYLPNSGPYVEESWYFGHGPNAIVAIGVSRNQEDPRRMIGIASGEAYKHLNQTQCTLVFEPTMFHVDVSLQNHTIGVTPLHSIPELYSDQSDLTYTLVREIGKLSNDQTNLYVSVLGNAFNQSITDYMTGAGAKKDGYTLEDFTLPGLENSLTAMVDDILIAYASAQFMIQQDRNTTEAIFTNAALRFGDDNYIYGIVAMNLTIIILVAFECIRTRNWKRIPDLDYLDPGALIVSSVAGTVAGEESSEIAEEYLKKRLTARMVGKAGLMLEI